MQASPNPKYVMMISTHDDQSLPPNASKCFPMLRMPVDTLSGCSGDLWWTWGFQLVGCRKGRRSTHGRGGGCRAVRRTPASKRVGDIGQDGTTGAPSQWLPTSARPEQPRRTGPHSPAFSGAHIPQHTLSLARCVCLSLRLPNLQSTSPIAVRPCQSQIPMRFSLEFNGVRPGFRWDFLGFAGFCWVFAVAQHLTCCNRPHRRSECALPLLIRTGMAMAMVRE